MLKNELKAALAVVGTLFPLLAQADQPMNSTQMQNGNNQAQPAQQAYVPGEMVKTGQLPAAYNASASYQTMDGWDIFITADYIYWAWQQDSFVLGEMDGAAANIDQSYIYQTPGYASGFQVGLGFNMPGMDDWNLYAEYTWYKNSNTASFTNDSSHVIKQFAAEDAEYINGTLTSNISMKFSALDFLLKRPFYFGKKLTANFSAGLSALWITQDYDFGFTGTFGHDHADTLRGNHSYDGVQTSWGLGPKFGLETSWLLGYGFQIMANVSNAVLYTSYNVNLSTYENDTFIRTSVNSIDSHTTQQAHNLGTLRPITEMFLGLGWNMGFCDDSFRFGLSVGYDFNVYWNYDITNNATTGLSNNMYLQGLNVGARFDF